MREIKFRAWINNKRMYYGVDVIDGEPFVGGARWVGGKLTQFTGLKDKNGKEIYEGDVLQLKHDDGELVKVRVFWAEHEAGFGVEELDGWDPMTKWGPFRNIKNKKIIGNIYENPGLLKEVSRT